MKNTKQVLLMICMGLLIITSTAVVITNQNSLIKSDAGGIENTSEKGRTFVLDSTTPLEIDGTVGRRDFGNLAVYAPNCSPIDGGVARLNNGRIIIYCPTAEKVVSNTYYQGFGTSTIQSITAQIKDGGAAKTIIFSWGRYSDAGGINWRNDNYTYPHNSEGNNEQETITITRSSDFLSSQYLAVNENCSSIYTKTQNSVSFDLISLTITYTCA